MKQRERLNPVKAGKLAIARNKQTVVESGLQDRVTDLPCRVKKQGVLGCAVEFKKPEQGGGIGAANVLRRRRGGGVWPDVAEIVSKRDLASHLPHERVAQLAVCHRVGPEVPRLRLAGF